MINEIMNEELGSHEISSNPSPCSDGITVCLPDLKIDIYSNKFVDVKIIKVDE
jgi:hypothetical protein